MFGCDQKTPPNRRKEDASQKLRGGNIKWTLRKSIKKHTVVYLWLPLWLPTPRRVTSYFLTSQVSARKKKKKPSTTTISWYPSGRSFQSFQRSKIWHKFSWGSNIRNSLLLLNHCSSSSLLGTTGSWCPPMSRCSWESMYQVLWQGQLSKTGITNLTKLNQKKMMEKYGSKGHIIETNNIVFS